MKMNEIWIYATRRNVKHILLSKKIDRHKKDNDGIHLYETSRKGKSIEIESKSVIAQS